MNFELLSPTITTNTVEDGKARTQAGKKARDAVRDQILSVKRAHTHTHTYEVGVYGCTIFNTLMI